MISWVIIIVAFLNIVTSQPRLNMAVLDASNSTISFSMNDTAEHDVITSSFTPASRFDWKTTTGFQISIFSFFDDLVVNSGAPVRPMAGTVQAITVAASDLSPVYTVSGLNADAAELVDFVGYWREILAGQTTIHAPDTKNASEITGDFVFVADGENLTGTADKYFGGAGKGLVQDFFGDAFAVDVGGSLKGGNDTINATNGGQIMGDARDTKGSVTGGQDHITLTGATVGALLSGDCYWGALNFGKFIGGADTINVKSSTASEIIGDAHFVGDDAKGGNDKITVTESTATYVSGDGFDSLDAGIAFGGGDTIVLDDVDSALATGDFDNIVGADVTGGNDKISARLGEVSEIYGDGQDASGSGSVTGGHDVIDAAETGETTIAGDFGNIIGASFEMLGGNDTITGGTGDDAITGDCRGFSAQNLFAGADSILGGGGDDSLFGEFFTLASGVGVITTQHTGKDRLDGGAGNDALRGQFGNDVLIGGLGSDTIDGGTGTDDQARFDTLAQAVTVNLAFGFALGQGNDTLQGVEDVAGSTGDDLIAGDAAKNTLEGLGGNDTLIGGADTDTLAGGLGNDVYVVDSTLEAVIEALNAGTDTIRAAVSRALSANVENLELVGSAAINGSGNILNNKLTGNAAKNELNGSTGADTMTGLGGDDIYFFDAAGDKVVEAVGDGTDTIRSAITLTLAAEVENLLLTGAQAINGAGNGIDNALTGNDAANVLDGVGANDTILGGVGDDTIRGGLGVDRLNGEAGGDDFDFNALAESGLTAPTRDIIAGFVAGVDDIDVSTIDAKAATGANDGFVFIGGTAFSAEGQIRATTIGGNTLIELNTSGTDGAEMTLQLIGSVAVGAADFVV